MCYISENKFGSLNFCFIFVEQNQFYMKENKQKHTVLLGEGVNKHTLYGNFAIEPQPKDFAEITIHSDSQLQHEEPNGRFAEHNTLTVDKGYWVMGLQVEYNPFAKTISRVWD